MSRIGKRAVAVPSGVTANVEGQTVKVQGPKGALQLVLHDDIMAKVDDGQIKVEPRAETQRARAQWGTSRTLIANLVSGVTKGFEQRLEINGVDMIGWNAEGRIDRFKVMVRPLKAINALHQAMGAKLAST